MEKEIFGFLDALVRIAVTKRSDETKFDSQHDETEETRTKPITSEELEKLKEDGDKLIDASRATLWDIFLLNMDEEDRDAGGET